jgi:TonB family protein
MMTEDWSSPQPPRREAAHSVRIPEKKKEKKNRSTLLIALIVIAILILGAVVYIYYQRNVYKKPQPASLAPPSSEQFIGAPAQAAEQNYMVSGSDSTQGTPQVTELAVSDTQGPASKAGEKKTPLTSKKAQERDNPERSFTPPPSAELIPESAPPVMASQAQPGVKQPVVQPKTEDTAAPVPFVAIQKEARIIRLVRPTITAQGYLTGIQGQVVIQVRIDATGKPIQTVTLKSTNDILIQPVIDAVMASQFAPAEMTTGPVASWLTIPFKFASK